MSEKKHNKYKSKILSILLVTAFFLSFFPPAALAADGGIGKAGDRVKITAYDGFKLREKATTDSAQVNYIPRGDSFIILDVTEGENVAGFGNIWYLTEYEGKEAYCIADPTGEEQTLIPQTSPTTSGSESESTSTAAPSETAESSETEESSASSAEDAPGSYYSNSEWESLLNAFPSTYHKLLNELREEHPSWRYEPYYHNFSLEYAADVELADPARNLAPYYFREYRDPNNNKQYDAGGWYACNRETILFMLDPRNWLNEKYIFMFEKLSEVESTAGERRLQNMFRDNEDLKALIPTILEASKAHGVSPVFVGARMLTEVQTTINGVKTITRPAKGTLRIPEQEIELLGLDVDPEVPYYNMFNIGAYQGSNPQKNAVLYAMGYGVSAEGRERMMLPWDSRYKAIYGGITFIKKAYLDVGQNTNYYMKFNLRHSKEDLAANIWHQYMGNVFAPATEADVQYIANLRADALDEDYTFLIPVFEDMPQQVYANPGSRYPDSVPPQQPSTGDGTEHTITDPVLYAKNGDLIRLSSAYVLRSGPTFNDSQLDVIAAGETVKVTGRKKGTYIDGLSDQWYKVEYKGQSGYIAAYPPEQPIVTEESSSGESEQKPEPFLLGDTNGDGKITVTDSLLIRYHLLGKRALTEDEMQRADTDKNGKITVTDSLLIRYHLLGKKPLEQ